MPAPTPPPSPAGAVPDVPIVVAGKWLAALRAKDATKIGALSASPFLIDGFDSVSRLVRDKCMERAEGGPKARWIRLRFTDNAQQTPLEEPLAET